MPLFIDNDVQSRVLEMADAVAVTEDAFTQFGRGDAAFLPRTDIMSFPTVEGPGELKKFWFACLQGAIREPPRFALRYRSDIHWFETDESGNRTTHKYNTEPGNYMGVVFLFDTSNGELLAIMNDGIVQHLRVGALAGVAANTLARDDATTVGMIGSGGMARTYAEAFSVVRELEEIQVYSRSEANRTAYAEEMREQLDVDVTPKERVEDVIADTDIVATCTNSATPVFDATLLEPGQCYINVNSREVDDAVVDVADKLVGTTQKPFITDREMTIGSDEEYQSFLDHFSSDEFCTYKPSSFTEIGNVLTGQDPGRESDEELIVYDNRSSGIQFAAVGDLAYREAKAAGLGFEVPLNWFHQDIVD